MNERLKILRKKLGLTQKQFADMIGITTRSLQNYEANLRKIPGDVIKNICEKMSVNPSWFLMGEGEMFKDKDKDIRNENPSEPVDYSLLEEVISGVEEGLEKAELTMDADKKARLIVLLYKYFEKGKKVDKKEVMSFLKLVG